MWKTSFDLIIRVWPPGTYYATGLGSCGITNSDTDKIVAVSHLLYDQYP